jgi:hypothetical protein
MSDTSLIKPPRVAVASEASVNHKIVGPTRTDGKPATVPKTPLVDHQRRAGQYGAPIGVQINRRGEAPVTKLATQTITVLRGTLSSLLRFCRAEGARGAAAAVVDVIDLVTTIENGGSIADLAPAPAPVPVLAPTPTPVLASDSTPTPTPANSTTP